MRNIIISLVTMFACAACAPGSALTEVRFEWFNLSTNEIWVTEVPGLPEEASPGRLTPSRAEDPLGSKTSVFTERVRITDRIRLVWKDNGKEGWSGGLKIPGSIPPGVTHKVEFKRDELGLPAKLQRGKVRLTYLGNEKWRITLLN
ncbi:MAG: hypothetical protein GYA63_09290 [Armatimonadetes bacterium]|nr:hypothetical protein [Armatimonadota bacterium]